MADAPDINQQLLQMQSLIASSRGGSNKGAPLLLGMHDVDCFAGLSLKGKGFNGDKTAPTVSFGKQGKLADKLFAAIQSATDDFRKAAQNAGVMYSGTITSGTPVTSNLPPSAGDGPVIG